jgi:hypothetical protein
VLRSNQAQDFGAGRKLVIVSCRCYSMASSPRNDRMRMQLKAEVWAKSARAAKEEVERSERLRLIR